MDNRGGINDKGETKLKQRGKKKSPWVFFHEIICRERTEGKEDEK